MSDQSEMDPLPQFHVDRVGGLHIALSGSQDEVGKNTVIYHSDQKINGQLHIPSYQGFDFKERDAHELKTGWDKAKSTCDYYRHVKRYTEPLNMTDFVDHILGTRTPVRSIMSFGLRLEDDPTLTHFEMVQHEIFGYIVRLLMERAHAVRKSYPTQFEVFNHGQLDIWMQDAEKIPANAITIPIPGGQQPHQFYYQEPRKRNSLGQRDTAFEFSKGHCLDTYGTDIINENSLVIILNRQNPWRQLLGRTLEGTGKLPLAVLCAPHRVNNWPGDASSPVLEGILNEQNYTTHSVLYSTKCANELGSKGGIRIPIVGPLNIYIRKPLLPLPAA